MTFSLATWISFMSLCTAPVFFCCSVHCELVMSLFRDFFFPHTVVVTLPSTHCMMEHGRRQPNSFGL